MRKIMATISCLLIFIYLVSTQVFASGQDIIEINTLIDNAKNLDGKTIAVDGEVIGEILGRGDYSWVNIKDNTNAIGLWMKSSDAAKIEIYGNYKYMGDKIIAQGIFNRACVTHGGEADIHVLSYEIYAKGYRTINKISTIKILTLLILFASLIVAFFVVYKFVLKKENH